MRGLPVLHDRSREPVRRRRVHGLGSRRRVRDSHRRRAPTSCIPLPEGFDDLDAAPLLCGGVIGYRSLKVAGVEPGMRVGLYGFGASATAVIQVAVHWGCEVYVVTRSEVGAASRRGSRRALGRRPRRRRRPCRSTPRSPSRRSARSWSLALGHLDRGGIVAINAIHLDHIPAFDYERLWWERQLRSVANVTRDDVREFLSIAAEIGVTPVYEHDRPRRREPRPGPTGTRRGTGHVRAAGARLVPLSEHVGGRRFGGDEHVTSWSRRVSAASQKPLGAQRPNYSKADVLKDAVALGVQADDQAALLALAKVAHERPGFRTTISVQTGDRRTLDFEVVHTDDGPVARQIDADGTPAPSADPTGGRRAQPVGQRCGRRRTNTARPARSRSSPVLTNTLVETPDLVAVFASVGHEALWANDAFVTLVPIRQADKVWLVELLDEWSKGHYEVKVLPALVKYGRWRGRLTLLSADGDSLPVSGGDRRSPRPARRHRRSVDGGARPHRAPPRRGAGLGDRDPLRRARRARQRHHRRARQRRRDPVREPGHRPGARLSRGRAQRQEPARLDPPRGRTRRPARARAARRARRRIAGRAASPRRRRRLALPRDRRERPDRQPRDRGPRPQRARRHRAGRGGPRVGGEGLHRSVHRPAESHASARPARAGVCPI